MAHSALLDVRWGEFDSSTIAVYGSFEFTRCLIIEDVAINTHDLRVLPPLENGLVGINEINGFV